MQFLTGSMISVVICVAAFVWMKKHPGKADFRVLYLISLNLEEVFAAHKSQDLKKSGIRLAAALVRGDKDTVEQIPESQRAQLVFGEDPLGIGQEVDPTAFCMELLQCADRGGIAL